MRRLLLGVVLAALTVSLAGCGGKVSGPRFWWDDRTQTRLPDDFQLPVDPGAPATLPEAERTVVASGEDLTDDNLKDYHTDLDLEEERRKSEASLFDF